MRLAGVVALTVVLIAPAAPASTTAQLGSFAFGPLRLAQRWEDLTREQQERAYRNYQRFQRLPREEREDVERRYERWKKLPQKEKDLYRQKYGERRRDD